MSALRKAGVWLGLVEEEDESLDGGPFDDEFGDDDDDLADQRGNIASAVRPRSLTRPVPRSGERDDRAPDRDSPANDRDMPGMDRRLRSGDVDPRANDRGGDHIRTERASVRQLARPSSATSVGYPKRDYPTHDNLALAPQTQLRERAVVSDDQARRYQITTLHPSTYNEARAIGEHFRDGHPVIMNLTEMDEPDAKRLVDFAAGLAFGLRGSMERVTNRVFLLSPLNIQVSAEDKARIAEGGFFDQA